MGRTDPVRFTHELAAEWRRLGAEVAFEPGWETRGVSSTANYEGAIVHHTGIGTSEARPFAGRNVLINGRPDLKGPLCNSAGPWCPPDRPRIHVIAAYPANHAGASGGRSMGPLPVTGSFNTRVWGHEVDYGGNVPMSPGQYRAALIAGRGVANVLGRSVEYVRAHAETSVTGKWDPGYAVGKTIDMAAFRRDAAALTPSGGFLMALTDAEQREVLENTRANRSVLYFGGPGQPKELTVYSRVVDIQMALTNALPTLIASAQKPGADPAELAAAVVSAIPDDLAQDVLDGLAEKLASRPPAA